MKTLLLLAMLLCCSFLASAQDRQLDESRKLNLNEPQLLEYPDLGIAAGIAQSPSGLPVMMHELIPVQSRIGIYGKYLAGNGVRSVILQNQGREFVLEAEAWPAGFFKLEMLTFRLPVDVHGEVWVRTLGRLDQSNAVRFYVE